MKKKLIFFIFFVNLLHALEYNINTGYEYKFETYKVYSNDKMSKLTFPYMIDTIGFDIKYKDFTFYMVSPLKKYTLKSHDYDYIDGNLVQISKSQNNLTYYQNVGIKYNGYLYMDFNWRKDSFYWKKTWQNGREYYNTLRYLSNQYLLKIGKSLKFVKFYLISGYIKNTDRHLLRGFYTIQNGYVKGFGGNIKYKIKKNIYVFASFERIFLNSDMRYYTSGGDFYYLKLKSRFYVNDYYINLIYRF